MANIGTQGEKNKSDYAVGSTYSCIQDAILLAGKNSLVGSSKLLSNC